MDSFLAYVEDNTASGSGYSTIVWLATSVGLWKMLAKTGEPGWIGFIPFYRFYKLCEKVMGDPWYWVRLFVIIIPVIGWALALYFVFQIGKATAKSFGQDEAWAWGYTFLSPVFYCLTGFGDYKYYGVMGSGDSRTGEARKAKTVDFDVVKQNQTDEDVVINDVRQEPAREEDPEVVEFTFDRTDDE